MQEQQMAQMQVTAEYLENEALREKFFMKDGR